MAPLIFLLALMLQDAVPPEAAAPDGPVATAAPRKQAVAPLPIQGGAVSAPTDDYGYVGWCYGAIASYVDLYDRAMPEVIRIERAWPTPSTEENIAEVYPAQREEAKRNLELFTRAMQAAESASGTVIRQQGLDAVRRGRAVWTGATSVPKAQLAQFWMSWSPPAKCEETARALEARSLVFGQALTYNAKGATVSAPPPPMAEETPLAAVAAPAAVVEAPEPEAAVETVAGDSGAMVYAEPQPSDDPEVEVSGDEPVTGAPSAIDALLPVGEPEPEATPVQATPAPVVAPPVAQPAKPTPPVRKKKRGLKETLTGMRGRQ